MKILVVLMLQEGAIAASTGELLALAGGVAAEDDRIVALALGEGARSSALALGAAGADEVLCCEEPALARFPGEAGLRAIAAAAARVGPDLVLASADGYGRDWLPRLAMRLRAGLVSEVTGITRHEGHLLFRRSVFGGKASAEMAVRTPLAMATVRPGAAHPAAPARGRPDCPVADLGLSIVPDPSWPEVLRREREETSGPALQDARIIVSGGRGVGGGENLSRLEALAALLGAAVGASRGAVDDGFAPPERQIGQTGKAVAPDLYIAVGISGASQHMVGCARAKTIVAINADPEAPIFDSARLGIVGDCAVILPALAEAVREASQ